MLKADPGDTNVYCNDCFIVAQAIVEKLSGVSLPAFVQREIFDKAGMRDSSYTSDPGEGHDYEDTAVVVGGRRMSEWEAYPWASSTSPHAKVVRDGIILRWGGEQRPDGEPLPGDIPW